MGLSPREIEDPSYLPAVLELQGLAGVRTRPSRRPSSTVSADYHQFFEDGLASYFARQRVLEKPTMCAGARSSRRVAPRPGFPTRLHSGNLLVPVEASAAIRLTRPALGGDST